MTELSREIFDAEEAVVEDCGPLASTEEDFAGLVRRQSRLVFRVAYSVLHNIHDAEDVTQETFLKLYRRGSWKNIGDERAFLARIAWRTAIDRRPKPQSTFDEVDLASGCETPEQMALRSDWNSTVHELIDALPRELRQALVLAATEEFTSHQIAEIIGVPDGTVRTRLQRARQILRTKLAKRLGDS